MSSGETTEAFPREEVDGDMAELSSLSVLIVGVGDVLARTCLCNVQWATCWLANNGQTGRLVRRVNFVSEESEPVRAKFFQRVRGVKQNYKTQFLL